MNYNEKCELLNKAVNDYISSEDIVVAFSGGVDSALLLKLFCDKAKSVGKVIHAVTVNTKLHPVEDVEIAKRVAEEAGAIHHIIEIDELKDAGIEFNPIDRCYRCKKYIFEKIIELSKTFRATTIIEGTNGDDIHQYRPGIKALKELGIKSPLLEASMGKKEIRRLSEELNISVAERPSAPCLATRIPYNTKIDYELLERVSRGEELIRGMGFYNVRLRIHGNVTRIEVDSVDFNKLLSMSDIIVSKLKELGFIYVTLDLEGFRSGSMDIDRQSI